MSKILKLWLMTLLALNFYSNAASAESDLSFKCSLKSYEIIVEKGLVTMIGKMSGQVVYETSVGVKNQPEEKGGDWQDGVTGTTLRLSDVEVHKDGLLFKTVKYHRFFYGDSNETAHVTGTWDSYRIYKEGGKYKAELTSASGGPDGEHIEPYSMTLSCQ